MITFADVAGGVGGFGTCGGGGTIDAVAGFGIGGIGTGIEVKPEDFCAAGLAGAPVISITFLPAPPACGGTDMEGLNSV